MLNLIRRYLLTNRLRSTEASGTLPPTPPSVWAPPTSKAKAVYLWTLKPGGVAPMIESEWEKIPSVVFGPTGEVMFDIMDGGASVACCLGEDMADALLRDHKLADLAPTLWQMLLVMANGHCEDKRLHYLLPYEPVLRCECGWTMELTDEEAVLLTRGEETL